MASRPTSPERLEQLRRLRDRGPIRFVLLHGVIRWGLLPAAVLAVLTSWWNKKPFCDVLPGALWTFAWMFGVLGVFLGVWMWCHICITCDRLERRPPA